MKITSGPYEVLGSGSVIGIIGEPLVFNIEDLTFKFLFKDDLENTAHRITSGDVEAKSITLLLYNFNNPLGTGNLKPVRLGKLGGQPKRGLYVNFSAHLLDKNGLKIFHYTWLTIPEPEQEK